MKKGFTRFTAVLLSFLMFIGIADIPAIAREFMPEDIFFEDAAIPSGGEQPIFVFGSRNMTVSEKSGDRYIMKIARTGGFDRDASITVKFMDISSKYGVNYTVSAYGSSEKPVEDEYKTSVVEFMLENADTLEEEIPVTSEELLAYAAENGGYDTVDADGNVISSVTLSGEAGTEGEKLTEEDIAALAEPQLITSEDSAYISDDFPGTELTLCFAAGETEKYIAVTPKYSAKADGDCIATISLKNPSAGFAVSEDSFSSSLCILDEDEHEKAVVSLEKTEYIADGDSISVTVTRSGAVNEMAAVNLCTVSDTAEIGYDFQGIDAAVYFPMGVESRTVEIPVCHTSEEEELGFEVKLVNPVNCTINESVAYASITPAEEGKGASMLLGSTQSDKYDPYLADRLWPGDFSCFGNAWNTDKYWFKYSCKGVDYDTWNGGTYDFANPYLYDGVRINWEAWHDYLGSISYTYVNTDNEHVFYSEQNEWDTRTNYVIFDKIYNKQLWIGSLTSYFNGIQVNVKVVNPIYRRFNFKLVDADPLSFEGVDELEAKSYVTAQFAGQVETVRTLSSTVGGSFAVAAPQSQIPNARLAGVEFLDKDGNVLYYIANNGDERSVNVELTMELMDKLAVENLKYDRESDGRYVGNIYVKPVYEYIEVPVTVKSSDLGTFAGFGGSDADAVYTFHLGDRLTLSGEVFSVYEGKYIPDGVRFEKRNAQGRLLAGGSGQLDYDEDGTLSYTIDSEQLVLTPVFRENNNDVRVRVLRRDVDRGIFDTSSGLFLYNHGRSVSGDYYIYTMTAGSAHLDQLIALSAVPASNGSVSVWSVPGANYDYSGNTFYFAAARERDGNLITLSYADADSFDFTGYVFNADRNLSTGLSSVSPVIPADGALVCAGGDYITAAADGGFYLGGVAASAGTMARILVYNNNTYSLRDVYLTGDEDVYNLGVVTAAAGTVDCASFKNVYFYQDGAEVTSTETLVMNGKSLTLAATVRDGIRYMVDGVVYTENVTGVTFCVLDGETREVKSVYEASEDSDGVWKAVISRFTPDKPDDYYYGDCFYVYMTTDRIRADVRNDDGEIPPEFTSTTYAMLSTGFKIIKDNASVEAQKFNLTLPVSAAQVLAGTSGGTGTGTNRAYARFPFIGSLDAVCKVVGTLVPIEVSYKGADNDEADEERPPVDPDDDDPDDPGEEEDVPGGSEDVSGGKYKRKQTKITFTIEELPYGGIRFKLGVSVTRGNEAWGESMSYNPREALDLAFGGREDKDDDLIYNDKYSKIRNAQGIVDQFAGSFGHPKMTFSINFGAYVDFGFIETTDLETGERDIDWFQFMGAGGYIGGSAGIDCTWFAIVPIVSIPGYVGVAGNGSATGNFGVSKDPEKVLMYSDIVSDEEFNADALHFNVDIKGNASVKGYAGIGIPDFVGLRAIVGLNVSFVFAPELEDYYKQVENTWGLGAELTLGGQLDLFVTKIPFEALSYPVYSAGFTDFFIWLERCNKLIKYTYDEINERGSEFDEAFIAKAKMLADILQEDIDNEEPQAQLESDFETLLNHVYYGKNKLLTTNERNLLYLKTPFDMLLSAPAGRGTYHEPIEHTDSKWLADRGMIENAAFQEAESQLLIRDSYAQPMSKITDIGNGCLLLTFLMDTSEEGETANPTLVYSVYNTNTYEWSEPKPVLDDGTADATPSVCNAGDRVIITWASAGKATDEYADDCEFMRGLEIYAAVFDKSSQTIVGTPEKLTDDEYMDYKPKAVYDSESGDMAVYYLKNDTESSDIADYVTTESLVCYRLYDGGTGEWVVDYYEEEYPQYSAEQRASLAERFNGQRFLTSAVDGDKPITDIAVCTSYNGVAVYAYTVDMDGDTSDNSDTELFVRVYDFRTHRTFKPIRITNDAYSQGMPQLVRCSMPYMDYAKSEEGEQVDGTTYLFWLENEDMVKYISVTDLIHNGINSDGTIDTENYTLNPVEINTSIDENQTCTVYSYQALTDEDNNLYIVWSQVCNDDADKNDITTPAALEIYAAAKINTDEGESFNAASGTGGRIGGAWSAPYRLTYSGKCNDGVSGVVAEGGKLYLTHNRYTVTYIGDTEEYLAVNSVDFDGRMSGNPYEIGATNLMLTTFEPVGSVEATEITFSDASPAAGETVTVTATVKNTGLTAAKGFSLSFSESVNKREGREIASFHFDDVLPANAEKKVSFPWTVPAGFDGMSVMCSAREDGYFNRSESFSDAIKAEASYEIEVLSLEQDGGKFVAELDIENVGNIAAGADDVLEVKFDGLYGDLAGTYGLSSDLLASVSIGGLGAKERRHYTVEFSVAPSAFEYCGYDQADFTVRDGEGRAKSGTATEYIVLTAPMCANLTNENGAGSLRLKAGESSSLSLDLGSRFLAKKVKVFYSSADPTVASVDENGRVTAVGAGSTEIIALVQPSGTEITIPVSVTGSLPKPEHKDYPDPWHIPTPGPADNPTPPTPPEEDDKPKSIAFTDVFESDYYYDAVAWAVENDITSGVSETLFAPDRPCTRAQMVAFLWRSAGCPEAKTKLSFSDVPADSWYAEAVCWAAENGITSGTGEGKFSPDATVTRGQTVAFLYRFAKAQAEGGSNPFRDVHKEDYYFDAVLWAAKNGITAGTSENTFSPEAYCTRAQIVTFLYRYYKNR